MKNASGQNNIIRQITDAAGGVRALARAIGVTHNAILQWERVPAERVLTIEKLTGVHRSDMRPDIYPPSEYKKARKL